MESDWAREHLQIIRTLMERTAVYRRALAPMTLTSGVVGLAAGGLGRFLPVESPRAFVLYWLAVAVVAGVLSLLFVRRQALRAREAFWSPPTRRVAQAAALPLTVGLLLGMGVLLTGTADDLGATGALLTFGWLPCAWIVLYGCAVHAAGFFMPRGIRLFGIILALVGCGLAAFALPTEPDAYFAHNAMAACFGGLHLAYGLYLSFTETRAPDA